MFFLYSLAMQILGNFLHTVVGVLRMVEMLYLLKIKNYTCWKSSEYSSREFENFFKDSGYWDFFLLSIYDKFFCVYVVYSLLFCSDFSIVERASWLFVGLILWPLNNFFLTELAVVGELFLYVVSCLSIMFCSALIAGGVVLVML